MLINAGGRLDPNTYPTKVTLSSSGAHGKAEYLLRLTAPMKHSHSGDLIVGWSALGKQQLLMHLATGAVAGTGPGPAAATAEGAGTAAAARGRGVGVGTGPRSAASKRPEALRAESAERASDGEQEGEAGPGEPDPASHGWRSVHGVPAMVGGEVAAGAHGTPQRGGIGYRMLPYDPYAALHGGERGGTAEVRQWGPEDGEGDEDAFPAPEGLLLAGVPRKARTARVRQPNGEPRGLTAWSLLAKQIAAAAATAAATDASAPGRHEDSGQKHDDWGVAAGREGPLEEVVEEEAEDGQGHSRRESLPDSVLNAAEQLLHLSAQPLGSGDEVEQQGAGEGAGGQGNKAVRETSPEGSQGANGAAVAARAAGVAAMKTKGAAVVAPAGSTLIGEGTASGNEGGGSVGGAASGGDTAVGAADAQPLVGSDGEGEGVGSAESGGHGAGGLWGQEHGDVRATAAPFSEGAAVTQGPRPRLASSGAQVRGGVSAAAAAGEPAVSSPLKRVPALPELMPQLKAPELRGAALRDGRPTDGAPTPALTLNNRTDTGVSAPSATASIDLRPVQSHLAAPKQLGVNSGAVTGLGVQLQVMGLRAEAARGAGGSDSDDAGSVRGHRQQHHAETGAAAAAFVAACDADRPGLAAPLGAEGRRRLDGQGSAVTGEAPGMAAGVTSSAAAANPLGAATAAGDVSAEGNKRAARDAAHGVVPAPTGPTDGKATEAGSWLSTATAAACGAHSGAHAPGSRPPAGDLPASQTKGLSHTANAAPEVAVTSPEHPLSPGDAGPMPPLHPPSLQLHANSTTASPVRVAAGRNHPGPEAVPLHTVAASGSASLSSPQASQPPAAATGPYVHSGGRAEAKPAVAAGVAPSGPRPSRGTDGETHSTATGLEGVKLAPVALASAHEQTPLPLQGLSPVVPLPGSAAAGYTLADVPASSPAAGVGPMARPPGKAAAASGAFQPVAQGRQGSGSGMLPLADGSPVVAPPPGPLWPFGPALPMPMPMPLQLQGLMQMGMGLGLAPAMAATGAVPGMGLGTLPMPMQPAFLAGFGYPDTKQQQHQLQMQMQGEQGVGQVGDGAARKAGGKVAGEKRKSEPLGLMDRSPGAAAAQWAPLDPTLSPLAKRLSTARSLGVPPMPTGATAASPAPPSREGTPAARAASLGDARDQQQQQQQPSRGPTHPPVLHPRSAFSFVPGALHPSSHAAGLPFLPMGLGGMHPMHMQVPLPYLAAVPGVAGQPRHSPHAVAAAPAAAGIPTAAPPVQQQHGNPGVIARSLGSPGPVSTLPAALGAVLGAAGLEAASGAGAASARTRQGAPISESGVGPAAQVDT